MRGSLLFNPGLFGSHLLHSFRRQVHIAEESCVPDHCSVYSLSDPSDKFMRQACNHAHNGRCDQCDAFQLLHSIQAAICEAEYSWTEDRDEAMYLYKHAKEAIHLWKCHHIRSVRQDQARLDILDRLDEETCLVTNDWAMKFLPQRYREAQSDLFGKCGISWHISVVVRRVDGQLKTQTFIHLLRSSNQGRATVVWLLDHVLRTLTTDHPEIQHAYFRQDNAGCYHSATTILAVPAIQSSSGVSVLAVDFSDHQGGKGPADRKSATCKNHIRRFINEGHDVTTAQEMKDAILSHGGIEGVRVAVVKTTIQEAPDKRKLDRINKLNNFEFRDDGCALARGAYGIGEGSVINLTGDKRESEYTNSVSSVKNSGHITSWTKARPTQPRARSFDACAVLLCACRDMDGTKTSAWRMSLQAHFVKSIDVLSSDCAIHVFINLRK